MPREVKLPVSIAKLQSTLVNVVGFSKARQTFCKRCDREQSGCGGQTKPIFWKKAKTANIVLRLECVEPNWQI
ncbi:hypothetical protein FD754_005263 [Muntiacus muntjak]|uniref:Uncharacterized protein n=1 Tax=Muntiacus muntjak TaxID=9888 RepID=A0A5N3WJF7_MUNMU|nr:hypothetical protein FD754_005263 [Muntiacus muntjak]